MSLSVPPAAPSASHLLRTLQELVRKTNRKTVEPYSLCDHKTLAVHLISSSSFRLHLLNVLPRP